MDYKKIIKSKKTRIKILHLLSGIPDKPMISLQYYIKTGRRPDLKHPKRFTEKLQWLKLYYRDPLMAQCADKYDVRQYITDTGLDSILNECYGVFDNPEDINFDALPNSFVLKDTLGSGGDSMIIVEDKDRMDVNDAIKRMREWVNYPINVKYPGREWVYDKKKHRIIVEKYIASNKSEGGLVDYKFFCFNGKPEYMYLIADRVLGKNAGLAIYDMDFKRLPYLRADECRLERNMKQPDNFAQMIEYAARLSKPFPHARIDFYNQGGEIIFGEITFFDGSGYMKFEPDEFDFIMGKDFSVEEIKR